MSVIGVELERSTLVLTKGRDFRWNFQNVDESGNPIDFPSGSLYFELDTQPQTIWEFTIDGENASLKVESDDVDEIPGRTKWQLVFKATGEAAGGEAIAMGTVRVQE